MTTGKTIALTIQAFVGKVLSLLFNMLSKFVINFLPRSKCLLIPWLLSPSAVTWEPKKIKSVIASILPPSVCHEVIGSGNMILVLCMLNQLFQSLLLPSSRGSWGFPDSSVGKESVCNSGDPGLIRGLGRSAEKGKSYPLQYCGMRNSMDCIILGVAKSWTGLSDFHFHLGFPGGLAGKESTYNAGDEGLIPGLEDSLEKGKATHSSILAWRIQWTV